MMSALITLAGVIGALAAQLLITRPGYFDRGLAAFGVSAIVFVIGTWRSNGYAIVSIPDRFVQSSASTTRRLRILLVVCAVLLNLASLYLLLGSIDVLKALFVWVLSILFSLGAFMPVQVQFLRIPVSFIARLRDRLNRANWMELGIVVCLMAVAIFMRFYRFGEFPSGVPGDIAEVGLTAMSIAQGKAPPNIFLPTVFSMPVIEISPYSFTFRMFGGSMLTFSTLTTAFTLLAIPAVYWLGRGLFGRPVAIVVAFSLVVSHWSVIIDRWGYDLAFVPSFAAITMLLLVYGVRRRSMWWFALSGLELGIALCSYFSTKVLPIVVVAFFLGLFLSQKGDRRLSIQGLAVTALLAILVYSPLLASIYKDPTIYSQRISEASALSHLQDANPSDVLIGNLRKSLLMFNVVGDTGSHKFNSSGEPMLDTVSGALMVLGLAYCLVRAYRPVPAMLIAALLVFLIPGALSNPAEVPAGGRSAGSITSALLLAGVALDQLRLQLHNLVRSDRLVSAGLIALVVPSMGYLNFDFVFGRHVLMPEIVRGGEPEASSLGQAIRSLGAGWDVRLVSPTYFGHPTVQFTGLKPQGRSMEPYDAVSVTQERKDKLAVVVTPPFQSLGPLIERLYPGASFRDLEDDRGRTTARALLLTKEQVDASVGLAGKYFEGATFDQTPRIVRRDASLSLDWRRRAPLPFPFSVEWEGSLNITKFGEYSFDRSQPGNLRVWLDGQLVLDKGTANKVTLSEGRHRLSVSAVIDGESKAVQLIWEGSAVRRSIVPSELLSPVTQTNGLVGLYYKTPDWSGDPIIARQDALLKFYWVVDPVWTMLGKENAYSVEWIGFLDVPQTGRYSFSLASTGGSWLYLDNALIVDNGGKHDLVTKEGSAALSQGRHRIVVKHSYPAASTAVKILELYWRAPDGQRELVPATSLIPDGDYAVGIGEASSRKPVPSTSSPDTRPMPISPNPLKKPMAVWGTEGSETGKLRQPRDVAVDSEGNVYIADGNKRIQKFDRSGKFLLSWNSFGSYGEMVDVSAVVVDSSDKVIVLDSERTWIGVFDNTGRFLSRWLSPSGMFHPRGLAVDADDNVYVADTGKSRVLEFRPDGTLYREIGGGAGSLSQPTDVAVGRNGDVYIADQGNDRMEVLTSEGKHIAEWPIPKANTGNGVHIALLSDGTILATDPEGGRILRYDREGNVLESWGSRGSQLDQLNMPVGLYADKNGKVFVADTYNHRIVEFTLE